jgi:hypothetical protein
MTTITRIGKEHIGVLIIANPMAIAIRARQIPRVPA